MGFKDADWAYTLDLPMAQKVVLVAVCHATDDKTHQTFRGQETLAEMLGGSVEKVRRALGALDALGVITRERRSGSGGFRTSDLITVNVDTYRAESPQGESPTRQKAYKENRGDLPADLRSPTPQIEGAEEIIQIDQPEDHPDTRPAPSFGELVKAVLDKPDSFETFYAAWPRKVGKPQARKAWMKARDRASNEQIIAAAIAYRDNPNRPEKQFIPHPATWLNRDGWNDELDGPRDQRNGKPAPMERMQRILALVPDDHMELTS
ncbi:hypothetical protein [Agromyces badenianii]|uniref:hypothetical protein n=1 Tax=Agromyces badenianii TaxID=2080742 RepID=UPI000D58F306|nr:hypothetical protein [Agromyces badenianii]PWC05432.1 hypothetical protein DCE94_03935 [Agromyces badenianii]